MKFVWRSSASPLNDIIFTMKLLIRCSVQSKKQKRTEFGQFHILKIGTKYIHAELLGSTKITMLNLLKI